MGKNKMRIVRTKKDRTCIVFVDKDEAIRIIKSLAHQIMMQSSNSGREEFLTEEEEYFTITVR